MPEGGLQTSERYISLRNVRQGNHEITRCIIVQPSETTRHFSGEQGKLLIERWVRIRAHSLQKGLLLRLLKGWQYVGTT